MKGGPFVVNVPAQSFEELSNIPKGVLGTKCVEYCLKCLCLEENRDFRDYPVTTKGEKWPDFSDDVKGKRKTFEIEVKNLSVTTKVSPTWVREAIFSRFSRDVEAKVSIIFGGEIHPDVPKEHQANGIHFIHFNIPVSAEDFPNVVWPLKNKLLEVPPIRRRAIVAISRIWKSKLMLLCGIKILNSGKEFLTLRFIQPERSFELKVFRPPEQWIEKWEEVYPFLEEDKPSCFGDTHT